MTEVSPPLTGVSFNDHNGKIVHTGIVVTRDLCPFITHLQAGVPYVLTSSARQANATAYKTYQFAHVQLLPALVKLVDGGHVPHIASMRLVTLPHNPWLQRVNETREDTLRRRKKLARKLEEALVEFLRQNNSTDTAGDECLPCSSRPVRLVWEPMALGGRPGLVCSGTTPMALSLWGNHEFTSTLSHAVYCALEIV